MKTKICTNPNCIHNGEEQNLSNFHKDKTKHDGYRGHCKDCIKKYHLENKEKIKEKRKEYISENRLKINETRKNQYSREAHKFLSRNAKRRADIKQATPKWADLEKINKIYEESSKRTKEENICYHVDHIYPLTSDIVCGLHVENNLQILIAEENVKKYNFILS